MDNHTLVIDAVSARSAITRNTWTNVMVGDRCLRVKSQDLQKGASIVFNNEAADLSLDEIKEGLERLDKVSVRYDRAKEILYEKNSKGELIPRLRTLALRGLAEPDTPDLEAKVLKNDGDFHYKQISQYVDRVAETGVSVGDRQIREWLRGNTLAPRNWDDFSALTAINSEFQAIVDSIGKDHGFHDAYWWYTGIHRTAMRVFQHRGPQPKKTKPKKQDDVEPKEQKFAEELEALSRLFAQRIDNERFATRITDVKKPQPKQTEQSPRKGNGLKRGICSEALDGVKTIDIHTLISEQHILENALYDMLNQYQISKVKKLGFSPEEKREAYIYVGLMGCIGVKLLTVNSFERQLYENNVEAAFQLIEKEVPQLKTKKEYIEKRLEAHCRTFEEKLARGEIDEMFRMAPGTASRLIDLVNMYRSSAPKAYNRLRSLELKCKIIQGSATASSGKKQKRAILKAIEPVKRELERVQEYLSSTYGYNEKKCRRLFMAYHNEQRIVEGKEAYNEQPIPVLGQHKIRYEREGLRFYTAPEVRGILAKLGIKDAIKLLDVNEFISSNPSGGPFGLQFF